MRYTKLTRRGPPALCQRPMWIEANPRRRRAFDLANASDGSAFELYDRISPVAILYGSQRLFVTEHNSARRLLKDLHRLGRARIEIRGMISEAGALERASIRALNCYLRYLYSRKSFRQLAGERHRFAWYAMQREVAMAWQR
jgi:hypothetical protein